MRRLRHCQPKGTAPAGPPKFGQRILAEGPNMYERMESVSSQDGQRQQKTSHGADFQEEAVNPSGPGSSFLEPVLGASATLGTFPAHSIIDGIKRCSRGSYRNGTNIRGDMDVDLVVQLNPAHGRNRAVSSAIPGPSWFHETNPSRAVTGCLSGRSITNHRNFPGGDES